MTERVNLIVRLERIVIYWCIYLKNICQFFLTYHYSIYTSVIQTVTHYLVETRQLGNQIPHWSTQHQNSICWKEVQITYESFLPLNLCVPHSVWIHCRIQSCPKTKILSYLITVFIRKQITSVWGIRDSIRVMASKFHLFTITLMTKSHIETNVDKQFQLLKLYIFPFSSVIALCLQKFLHLISDVLFVILNR